MKRKHLKIGLFILIPAALLYLSSCRLADIRTTSVKEHGITASATQKGKEILKETWLAHGFDKAQQFETYQATATDHWKGILGKMGKLWPDAKSKLNLRYIRGTFDSQVEFLDGNSKGLKAGLQSWNYYEQAVGENVSFKEKPNERIKFGLAAYQYFFELGDRLSNAPTILYGGKQEFEGTTYDVVFITWKNLEPTMDHDQYQLWIHPQTHLIDFSLYTLRESYLPGSKPIYGSIRFTNYRPINGVQIPFTQEVYANKPKEVGNYLHKLTVHNFAFDTFQKEELHIKSDLGGSGDEKPL